MSKALGIPFGQCVLERIADSELHVALAASVRGHDVYLIQPTAPPIETHLMEFVLLADACRRAGADRLTAVIPYYGYARQDRRASGREPIGPRVMADLIGTSAVERVVAVDLHSAAIEGMLPVPLEHLSAVSLLGEAVRSVNGGERVVIAPDLGASKLAEQYAARLDLPVAVVHKTRLIVDDMISTGGTIEAAVGAALAAGARPDVIVAATHALLVGPAGDRLRQLPLSRLIVTDSVRHPDPLAMPHQVVSLGPMVAEVVQRLHADQSLTDLIARR